MKETKQELKTNEFYFLISDEGYYLKTCHKKDLDEVSSWGNILFLGIIKNSLYIHYKLGQSWYKKRFSQLPVANPQNQTGWFDIESLDTKNCSFISEIKIGGSEKPETIESL